MTFTAMVAQPPPMPDDPGGRGEDFGKSSPVGLLVLLVFLVAVVFLARSMSKHLKRVPASFDEEPAGKHEAPDGDEEPAAEEKPQEQKNGA
ncbi:hypothetical protein JOF56_001248 [Kibdelosporangium banguiense]|uniref:Preprotein translocase subunit SecG n=1 Tax=Kibdelosporangium banguiense TaxID=1365924 RepID=A0ABS4T8Z5_9PSEU|nr:hypothetical protein [Kibdelosporangium banguiense]MBP2320863.1 hypothetical protein [Kibdelosporangium banguiense]